MVVSNCRMYEARYPEVDDVVMVEVKSIAEMGAYVSLLEYNSIEGMILLSELSRRRIRSVNKLVKVGRQEPVMVLRVDKEKGYIDLSKRRVAAEDVTRCEEKFNKSKMVHSIMRHTAETLSLDLEQLYATVAWPLYAKYGHAFDAFRIAVADPEAVLGSLEAPLDPDVRETILKDIKRRMTPQALKIRADIELTCFAYDGVLHIKEAMRAAERASTAECPVKIKLIAPPLYVLTTQTLEKDKGIAALTAATEAVKKTVEAAGGSLVVKEAARAVSERDDKLLAEKMEALDAANREVDGDADASEGEDQEGMGDIDVEAAPALSMP